MRALLAAALLAAVLAAPAAGAESTNETLTRLVAACTRLQQPAQTARRALAEKQQQPQQPQAQAQGDCKPAPHLSLNSTTASLACPATAFVGMLGNATHPEAQEAFSLPACSVWPLLEGRTVWLVGGLQVGTLHCASCQGAELCLTTAS